MKEKLVELTIDGIKVKVPSGYTIMQAAEKVNIKIPRLCYLKGTSPYGACRICVVEIDGEAKPSPSCSRLVEDGMVVYTNNNRLREIRKTLVELILANHTSDCPTCKESDECELLKLAYQLGVERVTFPPEENLNKPKDETSFSLVRDPNKCILCGRCIRVCSEIQAVNAIDFIGRGKDLKVATFFDEGLASVWCTNCGQCLQACPVGAIYEKSQIDEVWSAIEDPSRYVVVQAAPSIRVSLGEALGLKPGILVVKKMYAALRRLGFKAVFDTNFSADLTIVEEAYEFVERLKNGRLPQFTSCCPAWIKFMEDFYPDLMDKVSTCKSPQQMMGALVKSYYAKEKKLNPSNIVSVSIMPCTAKKFECERDEMRDSGFKDVDYVLTTRELARMIKNKGIDFENLEEEEADSILGLYTGAGTIFGVTGGVMEAALRTAYFYLTGKELKKVDFEEVRGLEGIKTASVEINGTKVNVAVAHGLRNASKLLDEVREGKSPYHFIEIMACPGGCVGGGGQPGGFDLERRWKRGKSLYKEDKELIYRQSHQNPSVKILYEKYLSKPGSELAHKLLHTHYKRREYF
ncbi:MAG: ferredoxin [Candidatus Omnitrophota bacterium]|nr:MAG: ferredoxin [Candidatus Omnitrophota bacterium]